jgi:spore germination cell wall hydrolase CwlJ-like protein
LFFVDVSHNLIYQKGEEKMHKLFVYFAAFISILLMFSVKDSQFKGIHVTYRDLTPQAQKQVDCLADNIYFEARSEPVDGQKAVALVTMNRVQSYKFPRTICAVVKEQTSRVCQFSWWCEGYNKAKSIRGVNDRQYHKAKEIALEVYLNHEHMKDITGGALFYHAEYVAKHKIGVPNLKQTAKIGKHIFYKA